MLAWFHTHGQQASVYSINKYNGLSTNHVYCTLVDDYGYLWLGTDDGVFRYNGYDLKRYGYKEGLSNVDVWGLHKDAKGRIWLRSIAQQFGYIQNNTYEQVYKDIPDSVLTDIYPGTISDAGDSLFFFNITRDKDWIMALMAYNDTLRSKICFKNSGFSPFYNIFPYAYRLIDSEIHVYDWHELLEERTHQPPDIKKKHKYPYNIQSYVSNEPLMVGYLDKGFFFYKPQSKKINYLNIETFAITSIALQHDSSTEKELIMFAYEHNKLLHVITNKSLIKIDSNLERVYYQQIQTSNNITYFLTNNFWGTVLNTHDDGLSIKYNTPSHFEKVNLDLNGYTYVNRADSISGYWWNNSNNTLALVNNNLVLKTVYLPDVYQVRKILPITSSKSFIVNHSSSSLLDNNTLTTYSLSNMTIEKLNGQEIENKETTKNYTDYMNDAVVIDSTLIYAFGTSHLGSYSIMLDWGKGKMELNNFDYRRYTNVAYSSEHDLMLCCSKDKVLIINRANNKRLFLNQQQLNTLNIRGIEQIFIDKYGNVIIKDFDHIILYNIYTAKHRSIFSNYQLEDARIDFYKQKLRIAGGFGLVQCTVGPNTEISDTKSFPNIKNTNYTLINDMQCFSNYVLLKTDSGMYTINTGKTSGNTRQSTYDHKIVINNNGKLHSLKTGDTIVINQQTNTITTDVIKPTGTGAYEIKYAVNKNAYKNTGKQIILPKLKAGSYNTISIIASDNSWQSKPITFKIYIAPKWWQTTTAIRVIFAILAIVVIGLIYVVVLVTRRAVNNANDRRNQRRELELKSIYSQINPHFIFNSLSTAQYFVKKNKNKEAYAHINQFSDLLRSYIKSSRNKYITIEEEIDNLNNYLELQLTRFEEKFNYNIEVASSIDASKVKIPSLLLQPLVENALNHGIFHMEGKGELNIKFRHGDNKQDELICIVKDNGIGREKSKALRSSTIKKADSYGTILIKELIDTFNKYEKIKIDIKYIDKAPPESGTKVIISIKNYIHA